jgi:diguanylate cyclase (GGDEF)-like protein
MSVSFALIAVGAFGSIGLGCGVLSYRLARQHLFDSLTGLPRQIGWLRYRAFGLGQRQVKNHWAIAIDLNRFNTIRYCLGRDVSDHLLVSVSDRIKGSLTKDEYLMRTGEDEFTIVLSAESNSPRALELANTVRRLMRRPFWADGQPLFITLSLGIASSDGGELHETLGAARVVMYRAKATGQRYPAVFDKTVRTQSIAKLQLEIDLRESISHSRVLSSTFDSNADVRGLELTEDSSQFPHSELGEEFRVNYQPIVHLGSGELRGFEALMRWEHPSRGRVSPVEFIPVCEETGLIIPLGQWILQEACHQARQWAAHVPTTHPLFVSVNVSGKQLQMPDFIDRLREVIRKSGITSAALKLEITESTAMEDVEATFEMFRRLRKLDINLGLDDFGTGYSSLSYLHRLPVQTLKLDKSFVQDLEHSRESQAIAKTIVALARTLRLKTIAEGIETVAQLRFLQALGCDYGQGYWFSPPLAPHQASQLLVQTPEWGRSPQQSRSPGLTP